MAYLNKTDKVAAAAKHYQDNKADYAARREAGRTKIRQLITDTKSVPCMDCGVQYPPYVMDLDHRPGTVKSYTPAQLPNAGSMKKALEEIAKCDVVCSNCHRQRTHDRSHGDIV